MRTKLGAAQITIGHYADEPGWDLTGIVVVVLHFGRVPLELEVVNDRMDVEQRIAAFIGRYPHVRVVDLAEVAVSAGLDPLLPLIFCGCDDEPDCKRCLGSGLQLPTGEDPWLSNVRRSLYHPILSRN